VDQAERRRKDGGPDQPGARLQVRTVCLSHGDSIIAGKPEAVNQARSALRQSRCALAQLNRVYLHRLDQSIKVS
jgi:hypothetical protein